MAAAQPYLQDRDSFLSTHLLFSIWIVGVCMRIHIQTHIEVYPLAYYKELNKVYKEAKTSPRREAVLCRENIRARKCANM